MSSNLRVFNRRKLINPLTGGCKPPFIKNNMKKQILETIEKVILNEIDEVMNNRFPSIYSNQDAVTLLYMLKAKLDTAIEEQETPTERGNVTAVLEDLKETIYNQGQDLDLDEYVDLDFSNNFGSEYIINIEVETYKVAKLYAHLIEEYIIEYKRGAEVEPINVEESNN